MVWFFESLAQISFCFKLVSFSFLALSFHDFSGKCPNDNSDVIMILLDDILGMIEVRILYLSIL